MSAPHLNINLKDVLKEIFFSGKTQKYCEFVQKYGKNGIFLNKNDAVINAVETLIYKALTAYKSDPLRVGAPEKSFLNLRKAINDNNFQKAAEILALVGADAGRRKRRQFATAIAVAAAQKSHDPWEAIDFDDAYQIKITKKRQLFLDF